MYSIKIQSVEKSSYVQTGEDFLDVTVGIYDGKKIVDTRKYGYAIEATKEDILADLQKVVETYSLEQETKVEQAEVDARYAQADETIESLTGEKISLEE